MQTRRETTVMKNEPGGNRTRDHKLKRLVLYRLSYRPMVG